MLLFEFAIGLIALAFLIHLVLWRIRIPRRQTKALLAIFLGTLPLGLAGVNLAAPLLGLGPLGVWECLHVAVFHVAMSLAYIVAYSALENGSPSMAILTDIADARGQGRSRQELAVLFQGGPRPVETRLQAMLHDNMVVDEQGIYCLTAKGRLWARAFSAWRSLLNLGKGG